MHLQFNNKCFNQLTNCIKLLFHIYYSALMNIKVVQIFTYKINNNLHYNELEVPTLNML